MSKLFPNLATYKTTSAAWTKYSNQVLTKQFPITSEMVTTFTSRVRKTFIDLKKLRDVNLSTSIRAAIEDLAEAYPDYEIIALLGKVEHSGNIPVKVNEFRLTASRNDDNRKIFISIQTRFEMELRNKKVLVPQTTESEEEVDELTVEAEPIPRRPRKNRVTDYEESF